MDLLKKLEILSDAAKYDASCSSSGSKRKNKNGLGNGHQAGICHSWSEDGRCISLLKILLTNRCVYDCDYCINRRSNPSPRASFTPEEVVHLTLEFYRRNYIEGLFLSSGIYPSIDESMEKMIQIAKSLRDQGFYGYIHMKVIPGADPKLVDELGTYIDRASVNIELPSTRSLELLAPQKTRRAIMAPMGQITDRLLDRKTYKGRKDHFIPAGQTTQMIVGASGESDRDILTLGQALYQRQGLKRVYYSAYVPLNQSALLPKLDQPPLLREHRIYQGDFLLRFYKFQAEEILTEDQPFFDLDLDPKANWALNHLDLFPMEINKASYEDLLRIPGIGPRYAKRILSARRYAHLSLDSLQSLNVSLKRAKHFITAKGKRAPGASFKPEEIKWLLAGGEPGARQLSFLS